MAKKYNVELVVRSSLTRVEGTVVKEEVKVEKMIVSGVAADKDVARVAVIGIKDLPGNAFKLFSLLSKKNINVDIILQSIGRDGTKDISFTVPRRSKDEAVKELNAHLERLSAEKVECDEHVAKLSLVGAGMASNPGVASKMFEALFDAGINIKMISTSEIKISVLINEDDEEDAMRAVHDAFKLSAR
jgi:aspartate kinase